MRLSRHWVQGQADGWRGRACTNGLAMRGCGRLGTPHRKALSDRAAVYYNSRVRSLGLGRLQEMLRWGHASLVIHLFCGVHGGVRCAR